jgi:hypothetical protein
VPLTGALVRAAAASGLDRRLRRRRRAPGAEERPAQQDGDEHQVDGLDLREWRIPEPAIAPADPPATMRKSLRPWASEEVGAPAPERRDDGHAAGAVPEKKKKPNASSRASGAQVSSAQITRKLAAKNCGGVAMNLFTGRATSAAHAVL